MREFTDRGGWWVALQFALFGVIGGILFFTGGDWGPGAMLPGLALGAAGAILGAWGLLALGENLSPYPHPRDGATLVERGPYRLARHPVYGGLIVGGFGAGLFDANPAALVATALLAFVLFAKARFEERRLLDHIPGYEDYRRRVRRVMIPWVL
jgi:protein-S-isoprenylcysteine O-methyltransferase Ste14